VRSFYIAVLCGLSLLIAGCGGGSPSNSTGGGNGSGGGSPGSAEEVTHVAIVVFENEDYPDVVHNSAMPYLNQLAQQGGLATQFYANVHPSIGNYFMMTTGQVVNTDDSFMGTFSGNDVATSLAAVGKTWKVYAESLPAAGYIGGDQYPYIKHHDPFSYFDNVRNDTSEKANIVPFTEFTTDMAGKLLPNYFFIVPNNLHNGHDCPSGGSTCTISDRLSAIDGWLQSNLSSLLADSDFASHGILIVTFDESATDNTMGGGRIAVVLSGKRVKSGFQSMTTYQFPSLLRFSLKSLGVTNYPGASASAPDMDEFLN